MEYIADYIKLFCEIEGIAGNERVAVLMGQSFWGAGYFTAQGHIKSGNTVVTIDTGLSKNTIIDLLCAFKPTVISSTPSFLLELEDISKNIRLKLIETTGEMLNQKTRNKLEKIFKAKVFDAYGMTEGIVGVECNFHDGYHFFPNKVHLEIIDPKTNELLENEQWGELVITAISDSIMPIIRYKTGDICKISSKKCPCGNSNPRIWIKGRKEKVIHLHEGAKLGYNEFRDVIVGVFGQSIKFNVNVKNNKKMSILNIDINDYDKKKIEIVKSKIININYETLYLSQAGKLRMIFKYKN